MGWIRTVCSNYESPVSLNLDFGPEDPGILVTQSLHKQQAGMGQALTNFEKDAHIKGQKRYVDHKHFNHAYLKFIYFKLLLSPFMPHSPLTHI